MATQMQSHISLLFFQDKRDYLQYANTIFA